MRPIPCLSTTAPLRAPLTSVWAGLRRLLRRCADLFRLWDAREFERNWLASLDDAQLWDMRLNRRQVREEAAKPFWKV